MTWSDRHLPTHFLRRFLSRNAGFLAALLLAAWSVQAQTPEPDPRQVAAATISPEWQRIWKFIMAMNSSDASSLPAPRDLEAWTRVQDETEKKMRPLSAGAPKAYRTGVEEGRLGDVPVLTLTPEGWKADGRVLIYVHGGGFTSFSARSTLFSSALMANRTGLKVISVDYTLAPHARWPRITDQVIGVYKAVLAQGYRPAAIGMWGDSAGGAIVSGAVLKLRDQGLPLPGALVLWAPWSDVSGAGDTYRTLANADPQLSLERLKSSADAYADPADQHNPYVSSVYGDFAHGYPPTLIQCGTREIFLSNCVRLYQAISAADRTAVLDIYEGMPHVFQPMGPDTPESSLALRKVKAFWDAHLKPPQP